jgi:SAM-dependent methyltransferase
VAQEMMFGFREQFEYFQCAICNCLQIAEIPADISKYYPPNYYTSSVQNSPLQNFLIKQRDNYAFTNKGIIGQFVFTLYPNMGLRGLLRMKLPKELRILDVGCGAGLNLRALSRHGFKNLLGIDLYIKENMVHNNNLKILKESIYSIQGEWDLIMFHHSFEHMPNPTKTLKSILRILSKTGLCLLRIPTVSSYAWQHYRTNWVQLDAPRHFYLYSLESIKLLADRVGFKIKEIYYDSTDFQFWGSEQNVKDIPLMSNRSYLLNPFRSTFSRSEIRKYRQKANKLNLEGRGDQAVFYLVK